MISLVLIIRLISSTKRELTHTMETSGQSSPDYVGIESRTYSPCELGSHFCNWSCWHIAQMHSGHLPGLENRTLYAVRACTNRLFEDAHQETHVRVDLDVLSCKPYVSDPHMNRRIWLTSIGCRMAHWRSPSRI
jgi:hypothetical protein